MYERIKEEVRTGRSIPADLPGYSKALKTIIDANVVTIGVAFILFTLATAGVKASPSRWVWERCRCSTAVPRRPSSARWRVAAAAASKRARREPGEDHRLALRFHGQLALVLLLLRRDPARGRSPSPRSGSTSASTSNQHAHHHPARASASVDQVRDTLDPLGYGDAKIQEVNDPELGDNVIQLAVPELDPETSIRSSRRSTATSGSVRRTSRPRRWGRPSASRSPARPCSR